LTEIDGQAVRVDVDRYGNPWVVNAKGEVWHRLDGKWDLIDKDANAIDIGVTVEGSVWIVRTNNNVAVFNPHINKFDDSFGYGGKGKAISVHPNGMPWIIGTDNNIWQLKLDNTWINHDSCGIDIAIGKDGSVWSISCASDPDDSYIMRLNRINEEWMVSDIAARRICALNEITALFITPRGGLSRTVI
jgi:exosome complex RNA-binding protein Rrp4